MSFTIKQARMYNGFTQVEMAQKMGISRDFYRKIEENPESATVKQARAISEITGIPVDDIFFSN
ncbi:helix-turn-helix transcriptional regulator [Candidatus Agathobaculum pullicola]|uniref:helix-turn-helix transcriptional regulator n=1 Tax=Candidatus Agathobaculum pullicola TaxID=2838426 RepID=UPI003F8FBB53